MAAISKNEKKLRREVEVLRAQLKSQLTKPMIEPLKVGTKSQAFDLFASKRQILPLKEIRKDLFKTSAYVVFAMAVLLSLKFLPIINTISSVLPLRR